jgi:hypothetical protein
VCAELVIGHHEFNASDDTENAQRCGTDSEYPGQQHEERTAFPANENIRIRGEPRGSKEPDKRTPESFCEKITAARLHWMKNSSATPVMMSKINGTS